MSTTTAPDVFHEGERYTQDRAAEREVAIRNGGLVAESIPPRAVPFLAQQRMIAVGSVHESGAVSASVLFGTPGLVSSTDGESVVIDRTRIHPRVDDPVWSN